MSTYEAQKKQLKNIKIVNGVLAFLLTQKRKSIETWISDHGYRSFNDYVYQLIDRDMGKCNCYYM